jgi:prepilin-type N-terminal cleavage/methylation domain-containing protein
VKSFVKQRIKKLLKDNGGFSLVELVVVIAIMGFLVAMIAPRILGLTDQAKATSADANAQKLESVITTHMSYAGVLLDGFTNLVSEKTAGGYAIPTTTANGQTVLSNAFVDSNSLKLHQLSAEEATELKNMGIKNVYNLNHGTAMKTLNEKVEVDVGVNVLMVGGEVSSSTGKFDYNAGGISTTSTFNNPEYMYRIVMGIGSECEYAKVKSIDKAPVAPDVLDNNGRECAFKNYCIVLPRLASTVARINDADLTTANSITFTADGREVKLEFMKPSELGAYYSGTGAPSPYDMQQLALISPNGSKLTKDNNSIFKFSKGEGFTSGT